MAQIAEAMLAIANDPSATYPTNIKYDINMAVSFRAYNDTSAARCPLPRRGGTA